MGRWLLLEHGLDFEGLVKQTRWRIIRQFCFSIVIAYLIPVMTISIDVSIGSQHLGQELMKLFFNLFSWVYMCLSLVIIVSINIRRLLKTIKREMDTVYHQSMWVSSNESALHLTLHEFIETNKHIEWMQGKIKQMIKTEQQQKEDVLFRVSAMAHDLKTPLTVIKGNSELLQLASLSEVDQQCLKDIERASNQLDHYFNQLIQYSKTFYEEQVCLKPVDGKQLEQIIQQECAYLIGEDIDYHYISDIDTHFTIMVDIDLMVRSVTNVVNNAIDYADDSQKEITVTLRQEHGYLVIGIWNNGSAFSEDVLAHFGKLFYREDSSRSSQMQHFGIGLAFVKQVMERHSGQLVLKNTNLGALVELFLPQSTLR